jgi:hypothetical protein
MANDAELNALQQSGRTELFKVHPRGDMFEGRVLGQDGTAVVTDCRGASVKPWVIETSYGKRDAYANDAIDVVRGFERIKWEIDQYLVHYQGDAALAFRQSLVNQMVDEAAYSEGRAEQIVDETLATALRQLAFARQPRGQVF